MQLIRAKLQTKRLQDLLLLLIANLLKAAFGIAAGALVLRGLGPLDAGRLATMMSIVGLVSIIGEFGLRDATVTYYTRWRDDQPQQARRVANSYLLARSALFLLATAVGLLFAALAATRIYPSIGNSDLLQLALLSLLGNGLLGYAHVIFEAQQRFDLIGRLNVLQSVGRFVLILSLFVTGRLMLPLLLLVELAVPLLVALFGFFWLPGSLRRPHTADRRTLALLFGFSKWIAVAAVLAIATARLDVLLLSWLAPAQSVGIYAAALALVTRLDLVKTPVLITAFPEAGRRQGRAALRGYVRQSLQLSVPLSLLLLPLLLLGRPLIGLLYGEPYLAAATPFTLLLLAFVISLNAEPLGYILYPLGRPDLIALAELLGLLVTLIGGWLLIGRYGIAGAAAAVLLRQGLNLLVVLVWVDRFLRR